MGSKGTDKIEKETRKPGQRVAHDGVREGCECRRVDVFVCVQVGGEREKTELRRDGDREGREKRICAPGSRAEVERRREGK